MKSIVVLLASIAVALTFLFGASHVSIASPAGVSQTQPTSYVSPQPPATPTGWWVANTAQNSFVTLNLANGKSFWANIGSVATVANSGVIVPGTAQIPVPGNVAGWSAVGFQDAGVAFTLSNQTLSLLSTTAWTIACAWRFDGTAIYASDAEAQIVTYPILIGGTTGSGGDWGFNVGLGNADHTAVSVSVWNYIGTHQYARQTSSAGGRYVPHVTVATLYSNNLYIALDGNTFTSVSSGTSSQLGTGLTIGARGVVTSNFEGAIAECLTYNTGSSTLRAQVQSYLTGKYVGTGRDN